MSDEKCKICGMDKNIRNPSGFCDHLYYPENLDIMKSIDKIRTQRDAEWLDYVEEIRKAYCYCNNIGECEACRMFDELKSAMEAK